MKKINYNDIIGKQFAEWAVLEYVGKSKNGQPLYNCRCSCSRIKHVLRYALLSVSSNSCRACANKKMRLIDNMRITKMWRSMMERCYNPNHISYKYYGGRGITVCERWHDVKNFYADVGDGHESMEIDRINNDGNYEPNNFRWTTRSENMLNTKRSLANKTHFIEPIPIVRIINN